ncbi:MAG: hypothetical protein AAEI92_10710 [Arenicellales bacterium]
MSNKIVQIITPAATAFTGPFFDYTLAWKDYYPHVGPLNNATSAN